MNLIFVVIDIGVLSGWLMKSMRNDEGFLVLEEVYWFKNGFWKKDGYDCWKIDYFIEEILIGFEKLKKIGIECCFVGIDIWVVDYCLIDE